MNRSITAKELEIKTAIQTKVKEWYDYRHKENFFVPGSTYIPASGKVYDDEELMMLTEASLEFHLTEDRFSHDFEKKLSDFTGIKNCLFVNSGSSANLLAITALTASELGDRALKEGDEVITAACGFPTTVNPIIQNRLTPVFVDIERENYNVSLKSIEGAITSRTKAIILAHTLGNPFEAEKIANFARKQGLWVIEDCCDALGSKIEEKHVGKFGDIATLSFYPAHHITTGEGGAVMTDDPQLYKIIRSFRDWGRDCCCLPGKDNLCNKRFSQQLGNLPFGYDHKYTYSNIGYNLKATEMQAAIGIAQMRKLPYFINRRKENYAKLREGLKNLKKKLILPDFAEGASPFGFLISIKENAGFSRNEMIEFLEKNRIGTRLLFAGNIICQPAYINKIKFRQSGKLKNTDFIMNNTFWIGVWPGITDEMINYMIFKINEFVGNH